MSTPQPTRRDVLLAAASAAIGPGVLSTQAQGMGTHPTRFLIPCYFRVPDGKPFWDTAIKAHKANVSEVVAIMNVGAGTIGPKDQPVGGGPLIPAGWDQQVTQKFYATVLTAATKAKMKVIGYVSTKLGDRPEKQVLADVAAWRNTWPGVSGVFLDEGPMGTPDNPNRAEKALPLYKAYRAEALKQFGKNADSDADPRVIVNFGNVGSKPDQLKDYLTDGKARTVADVLVTFEGSDLTKYNPPAWVKNFPPSRFATLLHDVADPKTVDATPAARLGYVFVTDDGADGNPWDSLPKYWDQEVTRVRALNGG